MDGPALARFIETMDTDAALRQRVVEAEQQAADRIEGEAAAIKTIASAAGFDLSTWAVRPDNVSPTPTPDERAVSADACCFVVTSTV